MLGILILISCIILFRLSTKTNRALKLSCSESVAQHTNLDMVWLRSRQFESSEDQSKRIPEDHFEGVPITPGCFTANGDL